MSWRAYPSGAGCAWIATLHDPAVIWKSLGHPAPSYSGQSPSRALRHRVLIRWLEQCAPDEKTGLIAACGKSANVNLVKIATVALETGMRQRQVMGLAWERVDFSRGVIRLELTKSGRRR